MTKEKHVPADRSSSPEIMQQLRQAVFQLSQSSMWENVRHTTLKGALISISSLITIVGAPIRQNDCIYFTKYSLE
ncbi:hypothetical protein D3OALGA1CA_4241 [Olavius algarvensis associated proteobacterium Delta 3]|nr:hypothetical protein D3OALGB2SA_4254 [Olavius algarvensis associated proteobacterium Delta 3]CAB5147741.1 hypothetical protein D3OALGA1CA_4241 [Olavius algarvensis associated proteobacterium Delta 3]